MNLNNRSLRLILFCIISSLAFSCSTETKEEKTETVEETSVATEDSEWQTLDLSQWRNYKADTVSSKWVEEDGVITLAGGGGGDLITKDKYENFELEMDWKISEGGNSGVFFRVVEADSLHTVYYSGPEIQIIDNDRHPDAKNERHRSGDNYDLQAVTNENSNPAGEWNSFRIISNNGIITHYMNGEKVVEYEIGSDEWKEQLANSKFADWPAYAVSPVGHIALQDHGNQVWFKNMRIKVL
ncbi:3-keto-disaccharide hydrolase [Chondrinema litorale]|uniref:3-keto-disaccharide hydrolase n=1 Tax=Chondrinema litorale TaxID=2994555 RepID=UPI002542DC5C|nr:DUF1080 domain-containing protein [Chondrinema litorale]UZR94183.1 DUF1080 domain-containing protein [Chondrinema litorale]